MTDTEAVTQVQNWLTLNPNDSPPWDALLQVLALVTAQNNKLNEIAHCLFTLGLVETEAQQWVRTQPDGNTASHASLADAAYGLWNDYSTPA